MQGLQWDYSFIYESPGLHKGENSASI